MKTAFAGTDVSPNQIITVRFQFLSRHSKLQTKMLQYLNLICCYQGDHIKIKIYMLQRRACILELRGDGGMLARQEAWHENTKGTAQRRSFFVNVDERV